MSVKVTVFNKQKAVSVTPEIKKLIRQACKATLKSEEISFDAQIDVSIVDDEQIKVLNSEYRDVDASTDVLSFPLGENGEYDINPESNLYMLGDVVISIEHALSQADLYGHGADREIAYLTVHSVLHLLGYDHIHSSKEKSVMRAKEEKALSMLGLTIGENNGK